MLKDGAWAVGGFVIYHANTGFVYAPLEFLWHSYVELVDDCSHHVGARVEKDFVGTILKLIVCYIWIGAQWL